MEVEKKVKSKNLDLYDLIIVNSDEFKCADVALLYGHKIGDRLPEGLICDFFVATVDGMHRILSGDDEDEGIRKNYHAVLEMMRRDMTPYDTCSAKCALDMIEEFFEQHERKMKYMSDRIRFLEGLI